ncbi:DUF6881 domain-containing protein [Nocardia sp. NPDC004151]|uniref:DUF6881 domain-containing protein n=1 Tax=Nocardia sp. NPDC004151 TaxID=3364304 RepID=UPI0036BA7AD0
MIAIGWRGQKLITNESGDDRRGARRFIRQQLLVNEIAREIVNWAPDDWTDIDVLFSLIGRRVEVEVVIDSPDSTTANPIQFSLPDAVAELRELMYVSGVGTWFTMQISIHSSGGISTSFDYGKPSMDGDLASALQDDLAVYPLDVLPSWMEEELGDLSGDINNLQKPGVVTESNQPAVDAHNDSDGIDRDTAAVRARGFVSAIPGARYMKVIDRSDSGGPVFVFSEVLDSGQEWRRVELFRDGSSGLAAVSGRTERTRLHVGAMPLPKDVASTSSFIADEISAEEFQTEWLAAGGW